MWLIIFIVISIRGMRYRSIAGIWTGKRFGPDLTESALSIQQNEKCITYIAKACIHMYFASLSSLTVIPMLI